MYAYYSPASKLPESKSASWCAERSSGNQAEESNERTMLAIPTVRVLRSVSGADEVVEEAGALLGCDTLQSKGTRTEDNKVCVKIKRN